MSIKDAEFWRTDNEHQALVEQFERNIERVHPGAVGSNRLSPFSEHGIWNTTAVNYYDYRGPNLSAQS